MTFGGRLVLGTTLVLVFTMAILVGLAEVALRRDLEQNIRRELQRDAQLVREALPTDSLSWERVVQRLGRQNQIRVTVIDSTGRVRAESEIEADLLSRIENHLDRPEIQAARRDGMGWNRRRSTTIGVPLLYVAVRGGPGFVRVAAPLEQVDAIVHRAQRTVAGAALLALTIGTLLAFFAGRSVARPLTAITAAARSIAAGEPPRLPHSGIPDIESLVQALRTMHAQLGERFEALRRERAESRALIESMVEGVIAADERGHITTANAAARRLLGYDPDEPLPDLTQLFRVKAAREVVDAAFQGRSVLSRELELDSRTVLLSARPLPAGGAVLVIHNVTEIRRLEVIRRDFAANVSHELKTPLTSISGYAETLLGETADPETSRGFLRVILGNARRMQRLVDDLLDLSRIESGYWQPHREPLDLRSAAHEAWDPFAERAAAQQVSFAVAGDAASVSTDPDALRQVLGNLFDNALRYTPPGGQIRCEAVREPGGILLSVSDTGSGIGGEHLPRIFERFYRADSGRSRGEGGTGLGLAIVKHLVEAHGGRVRARSELGSGTTIECWFPDEAEVKPNEPAGS